jgi:hypothetical protein
MRHVTVADLKQQTGVPGPRPVLYCPRCGASYSANRGDYFMAKADTVLRCECNGHPLKLGVPFHGYRDVA